MTGSIALPELATALAALPQFKGIGPSDLEPLAVKGIAHDHVRLKGRGLIARVPRQSQFALPAEDNLAYQAACFARAAASGHTPRLDAVIAPNSALPMGALVVEEIVGRPMALPSDLPRSAAALAAIHTIALPAPAARPPLVDHADAVGGTLGFIERQWALCDPAWVPQETLHALAEEVAWGRAFAAASHPAQPQTLIATDSHPGNFLIDASGRAVFVDLEKMLYGSPAVDLAHHTLYTSTTWDVDSAAVLSAADTELFHRTYFASLLGDLAAAIRPWIQPMRRLTWIRTMTWAIKWRRLTSPPGTDESRTEDWSTTPLPPAYRAHVRARIADFLDPATVARVRAEWI